MTDLVSWNTAARAMVNRYVLSGEPFTANTIWDAGLPAPPDGNRRRLGSVMLDMKAEGTIEVVDRGHLSDRGHGSRNLTRWRGLPQGGWHHGR